MNQYCFLRGQLENKKSIIAKISTFFIVMSFLLKVTCDYTRFNINNNINILEMDHIKFSERKSMSSKFINIKKQNDWSDFFGNEEINTSYKYKIFDSKNNERIVFSSSNTLISWCCFYDLNSTNSAINFVNTGATHCLLIENTNFINCNNIEYGAINLYNLDSVLNKVCGVKCSSLIKDGFCCAFQSNKNEGCRYINSIYMSSISRCTSNIGIVEVTNGNIHIETVNLSYNTCKQKSTLISQDKLNKEGSVIKFSSFAYNEAKVCYCLYISNDKHEDALVDYSNIIYNSQYTNDSYGLIYSKYDLIFEHCCIMSNNAKVVFDNLLNGVYGNIYLVQCSVSKSHLKTYRGNAPITNDIGNSYFVNVLWFLSTGACENTYFPIENVSYVTLPPYKTIKIPISNPNLPYYERSNKDIHRYYGIQNFN